ncbi:MAG: hypothetical protein AAFO89_01620 [Planctomycetota bacterium]
MTPSELIELGAIDPASMTIRITDEPVPPATPAVIECWDAMRIDKPRLFNGPVLSYTGRRGGEITVRRDSYQRLAVQERKPAIVDPPVMQLSVTGVVTALDDRAVRHVLVGRRSHATRVYGGMWEFGPSGGIDPPPSSVNALGGLRVFEQLATEMREETGLRVDAEPGPIIAITIDRIATSADLVMRLDLPLQINEIIARTNRPREHDWEYEATRWIPCSNIRRFAIESPCIPPTIALATLVGALA